MKDIPLDLSFLQQANPAAAAVRKTKQLSSASSVQQPQRNNHTSSTSPLPIITLSSFSNFEEKLKRMATNNNQPLISPTFLVESLTAQIQTRAPLSNRSTGSSAISRSSLNFPSTLTRTISPHRSVNEQLNDRCLQVSKPPMLTHRTYSTRTPGYTTSRSPRQPSALNRSVSEYDHFLTYLRRQSLARTRRLQEEQEEARGNTATTKPLNFNNSLPAQQFHQFTTNSPPAASRAVGRPTSTFRPLQRSAVTYHGNQAPKILPAAAVASNANGGPVATPANSVVNDGLTTPVKAPYELHENKDKLSYSYISDSGVKYQGQMLATSA